MITQRPDWNASNKAGWSFAWQKEPAAGTYMVWFMRTNQREPEFGIGEYYADAHSWTIAVPHDGSVPNPVVLMWKDIGEIPLTTSPAVPKDVKRTGSVDMRELSGKERGFDETGLGR